MILPLGQDLPAGVGAALSSPSLNNVLADKVFQQFRFAGAGAAANMQVVGNHFFSR
jgi:hypothetical protein